MGIPSYDYQIEKQYHPENFMKDELEAYIEETCECIDETKAKVLADGKVD